MGAKSKEAGAYQFGEPRDFLPTEYLKDADKRKYILAWIHALTLNFYDPFALRYGMGMDDEDIAEALGISPMQAGARVFYAEETLKDGTPSP